METGTMTRFVAAAAAALGVALAVTAAPARASVIYNIEESVQGYGLAFAATLTETSFIASQTLLPIADFNVSINPGGATQVLFSPATTSTSGGGCAGGGQSAGCDLIEVESATSAAYSFFAPGAIGTVGSYTDTDGIYTGTLTVTQSAPSPMSVSVPVSVPEPASLGVLGAALIALSAVRRLHTSARRPRRTTYAGAEPARCA
jgi:hypothetical protein